MKFDKFEIHIEDVFFKKPLRFGNGLFEKKQSLFVNSKLSNGSFAEAELSFLPFLHQYSLTDIQEELISLWPRLAFDFSRPKLDVDFFNTLKADCNVSKAAQFTIESLLLIALKSLNQNKDKDQVIKNNALFIPYAEDNLDELIEGWQIQKIECLKVKIGHLDFDKEISIIKKLQKFFLLRLDANRSLSVDGLNQYINQVGTHNIDYWEEPLKDFYDYSKISQTIPIAYDENVKLYLKQEVLIAKALVLKPSYFGSLSDCFNLISKRSEKITISSSFETKIGLNVLQQLALFNNRKIFSYSGLDTLKYIL